MAGGDPFGQHPLDIPVHIRVDGKGHVAAVLRRLGLADGSGDHLAAVATLVHGIAVGAAELFVQRKFKAGGAAAVIVDAAEQRTDQRVLRIHALAAQLAVDNAAKVQFVDGALHLGRNVLFQNHVLVGAVQIGSQFHRIHVQQRREQTRNGRSTAHTDRFSTDGMAIP